MRPKLFWPKNICYTKRIFSGKKYFLHKKDFSSKIFFYTKMFFALKDFFRPKNIFSAKNIFFSQKCFSTINDFFKNVFSANKMFGCKLTTPPPRIKGPAITGPATFFWGKIWTGENFFDFYSFLNRF